MQIQLILILHLFLASAFDMLDVQYKTYTSNACEEMKKGIQPKIYGLNIGESIVYKYFVGPLCSLPKAFQDFTQLSTTILNNRGILILFRGIGYAVASKYVFFLPFIYNLTHFLLLQSHKCRYAVHLYYELCLRLCQSRK